MILYIEKKWKKKTGAVIFFWHFFLKKKCQKKNNGGEGYFGIKLLSSNSIKTGKQVRLIFQLTQHTRDEFLMKSFIKYFECGNYYSSQKAGYGDFIVIKLSDHINKIIPFFLKNKILGEKSKDFNDWCKGVEILKAKEHLTEQGLAKITELRNSMNKKRY